MSVVKEISPEGILTIYHNNNSNTFEEFNIKGMSCPVVCNHCSGVYDLYTVKVNHRYGDCDQFTTPCCDYKFADNREWKERKDYERLLDK
jgi:hypothetical protein